MPLSCTIDIRIKPNARRQSVEIGDDGIVHVRVNAPPVEGRANTALIEILSETLDVPKSCVSIKRGLGSRNKVVEIVGLTKEDVLKRVERRRS
jgi:uncharacterized protein (TIGR00251 family)